MVWAMENQQLSSTAPAAREPLVSGLYKKVVQSVRAEGIWRVRVPPLPLHTDPEAEVMQQVSAGTAPRSRPPTLPPSPPPASSCFFAALERLPSPGLPSGEQRLVTPGFQTLAREAGREPDDCRDRWNVRGCGVVGLFERCRHKCPAHPPTPSQTPGTADPSATWKWSWCLSREILGK